MIKSIKKVDIAKEAPLTAGEFEISVAGKKVSAEDMVGRLKAKENELNNLLNGMPKCRSERSRIEALLRETKECKETLLKIIDDPELDSLSGESIG